MSPLVVKGQCGSCQCCQRMRVCYEFHVPFQVLCVCVPRFAIQCVLVCGTYVLLSTVLLCNCYTFRFLCAATSILHNVPYAAVRFGKPLRLYLILKILIHFFLQASCMITMLFCHHVL